MGEHENSLKKRTAETQGMQRFVQSVQKNTGYPPVNSDGLTEVAWSKCPILDLWSVHFSPYNTMTPKYFDSVTQPLEPEGGEGVHNTEKTIVRFFAI
jgi:hypothetical protein